MLEKLIKKRIKYKLSRKTLENLKGTLGLKGEGTKDSPVIIDDLSDVFVEFSIKTKGIYLVLKNLNISKLLILGSQNVVIENCFVGDLDMARCRNLTFRNNSIITAQQLLCRSCFFENNSVLQKQYTKFINNTYERRSFVGIWILLVVGMLYSHIGVSSLIELLVNFVSITMLLSGILLSIAMIYLLTLRYQANKIPQNKYINFTIQKIEAFSNAFIKVV
ncbi:unnamed protein product [marine sediment metagenome]|uniref:Uncharacterized protein n=1 Tax=marine sediment metagenome TaxID=412755 RepID=X1H9C7_9ZZZZ